MARPKCPRCSSTPPRGLQTCPEHNLYCVEPAELAHTTQAPLLGRTLLDRYVLVGYLGGSGRSVVYRGLDADRGVGIAVKVFDQELLSSSSARVHFQRQALALTELKGTCFAPVHAYGAIPDGLLRGSGYLVMDRVRGLSLAKRLTLGPLSPAEAEGLLETLAPDLDRAHALGLVHRDLRPENLLYAGDEGDPRLQLVGFDLARPGDPTEDLRALAAMVNMALGGPAPGVGKALGESHATGGALLAAYRSATHPPQRPEGAAADPEEVDTLSSTPPRSSRRRLVWGAVAAVVLVGAALWFSGGEPEPESGPADDDVVRVTVPMGQPPK